jgi:hypothetical protein
VKNQYFGDVNDYWKYGLLRGFASAGLAVGVCWLLTPDDDGGDGKQRAYLKDPKRWESSDPSLFAMMQRVNGPECTRDVRLAETLEFIPGARYFSETLTLEGREEYFTTARLWLQGSDLVFFDPDNGVEISSVGRNRQASVKYVFWSEVATSYGLGCSVVVYQHIRQVNRSARTAAIVSRLQQALRPARIDVVGPAGLAFIVVHQAAHTERLSEALRDRKGKWLDVVADGLQTVEPKESE